MNLIQALRIDPDSRVSIVGSGGKTSALTRLSMEWPTISLIAATTHLELKQTSLFPRHITWAPGKWLDNQIPVTTLITGEEIIKETRIGGVHSELWPAIEKIASQNKIPVFIESDGSKKRPLKAPADHEPAIPSWVNQVVVSVGLSVVGAKLDEANVHRPELFSKLTGLAMGESISFAAIEKMLTHPHGGLKNIPDNARRTVLLNQIDALNDKTGIISLEKQLLKKFDAVVTSSFLNSKEEDFRDEVVRVGEHIAGIILAAGQSHRMGKPKALMNWQGIPFVRACALTALSAGLNPIYIIAGKEKDRISAVLQDLPVVVVENLDWDNGQSTSVHTGIKALPDWIGGAIFLLVDQPQIPVTLVRKLVSEHSTNMASIIYPESGGRRANPVLFDRRTFEALLEVQGDVGGRAVFSKFPVHSVPWFEESILIDVDTPEDYQRLIDET